MTSFLRDSKEDGRTEEIFNNSLIPPNPEPKIGVPWIADSCNTRHQPSLKVDIATASRAFFPNDYILKRSIYFKVMIINFIFLSVDVATGKSRSRKVSKVRV